MLPLCVGVHACQQHGLLPKLSNTVKTVTVEGINDASAIYDAEQGGTGGQGHAAETNKDGAKQHGLVDRHGLRMSMELSQVGFQNMDVDEHEGLTREPAERRVSTEPTEGQAYNADGQEMSDKASPTVVAVDRGDAGGNQPATSPRGTVYWEGHTEIVEL